MTIETIDAALLSGVYDIVEAMRSRCGAGWHPKGI